MDRPFSFFTRRDTYAARMGMVPQQLLYVFLAFQLVDQIVLPVLLATFLFSKSAKRHPTVVNVCLTWIISGIISSLLLYTGTTVGPEPPKFLCISQAALLDGIPPMTSVAALALVYQAYLHIRKPKDKPYKLRTVALLIAPYVTFLCFATSAAILAMQHPETVSRGRRFFYCSFPSPMTNAFALFTAVILLTTLGYQIAIGIFLSKNWRALRQSGSLDIQFLTRTAVFGVYLFITLVLCILSVRAPRSPLPDLVAASVGPVFALILGTQPDIYRAWFRRPPPAPPRIVEDWLTVETGDKNTLEPGDKVPWLCDEEATGGGIGEERVIDITARFKRLQHDARRRSPSIVVVHESDTKEVDIASPRRGYHSQPQGVKLGVEIRR